MTGWDIALIVGAFVLILVGAEVFTNGVEWLGLKLRISEGATGSILAAIGTATPETLIPVVAILFTSSADSDEIGVGAILGAPFMLGTLVLLLIGLTALLRRIGVTFRDPTPPLWLVLTQTIIAFAAIVLGARFFADFVEDFSHAMHFNTLLVALILAPLATELPEAANSLIWTRDSKDVIALGNVTGAMVFQSTFPVTIGVLLTPWQLGQFGTVAAVFALLSGLLIYVQLRLRARENALPLSSLMLGGSLYVVFLAYVLWSVLA